MILTAKDIAEVTRLLDESQFSELRLEIGAFKLRVSRGGSGRRFVEEDEDEAPAPTPTPAVREPAPAPAAEPKPSAAAQAGEVDIPAPLLGNFYRSPRPGDPPFVEVGDTIGEDSAIGIIEVMKLMNSVRSGVAGTVVAVLAEDGKAVEEGQPLIRVKVG
ncbi:MAG: acetyl-CoA carboxylase biotin carboxyl carrier protein [Novosphingobium sp.]|nr:acetyl-CoA carboxylase biotin carboxyl carrier protein [Novosphingobium sp.]MBO9603897.1 acetyl-CoA carboxylase biotin carboxyl carrier protein [Novosphingobium sp.]